MVRTESIIRSYWSPTVVRNTFAVLVFVSGICLCRGSDRSCAVLHVCVSMCTSKTDACVNPFEHCLHLYGRSTVCLAGCEITALVEIGAGVIICERDEKSDGGDGAMR